MNLKDFQELLADNKGNCEIWFKVADGNDNRKIRSKSMKINPDPGVLNKIRAIFGPETLKIFGQI